ncbi:MAG: biotin--[acetyl-CoA-carboxylase] ligase [Deltaproteobacteria bacterium]|nr:biotin--[acetyl-CoA-carboxylase] ligase [Deltaproteobacteria bacterium]
MQGKNPAELKIIRVLKGEGSGYVSGQSISSALGISRTAVWKHMNSLKGAGFPIEASPSKGYRLASPKDPFNGVGIAAMLTTDIIGKEVVFFPSIDSTNVKAFELGRNGAPEGTAVVADRQTKGKGRIGRKWESPPGVNLYASIILRPGIMPHEAHQLTFLMAVAAVEAISPYSPRPPKVKWPNDILIDSKKAAGILMEMDSEADRVHFVVAGIGVNLNIREKDFPDYIKGAATSLRERCGQEIDRAAFTRGLFSSMEKWYRIYLGKGFAPVLDEWKRHFGSEGKPVRIASFHRDVSGICMGVDNGGALLVKTSSGVERVISGDVEAGE